ncbi:MAG: MiaB/RimO family radical SAM methylthiotransferase [Oscillospiraceae bacterium]|nr:MiaB/RimO family radical SAM methylthiotransferase [Oscillospiraceae bacterium]
MAPKAYIGTLGCKVNQSDSASLAEGLASAGFTVVGAAKDADVCVLNTCCVTNEASRKSGQAIRAAAKASPDAVIAVVGCLSQAERALVEGIAGVDYICGTKDRHFIVGKLAERFGLRPGARAGLGPGGGAGVEPEAGVEPAILATPRSRAFIKVQDGCSQGCSYCIVPTARGEARSADPAWVLSEVARLGEGFRELVFTGIHVSSYGTGAWGAEGFGPGPHGPGGRPAAHGKGTVGLAGLVAMVASASGGFRIRLGSLEPQDVGGGFFDALRATGRVCPHFHIPLQSGCDAVLRRMGRRYDAAGYASVIGAARAAFPDCSITTDLMVGFPGEGEAEFAESARFTESMGFMRVHAFRYSPKGGTPAAGYPGQVGGPTKRLRLREIQGIGGRSFEGYAAGRIGRDAEVLLESASGDPADAPTGPGAKTSATLWEGYTGDYLRVYAHGPADLAGRLAKVRLTSRYKDGLYGAIL